MENACFKHVKIKSFCPVLTVFQDWNQCPLFFGNKNVVTLNKQHFIKIRRPEDPGAKMRPQGHIRVVVFLCGGTSGVEFYSGDPLKTNLLASTLKRSNVPLLAEGGDVL